MKINRVYTNAAGDTIRIDEITRSFSTNFTPVIVHDRTSGSYVKVGPQHVKITPMHSTGASRVIAGIEIIGKFESIETASGNYTWASQTLGDGTVIEINMSDLPGIGDSV